MRKYGIWENTIVWIGSVKYTRAYCSNKYILWYQAYFGSRNNLSEQAMNQLRSLFSAEDVVKKGLLADIMYMSTANKNEAKSLSNPDDWKSSKGLRIYEVFPST